MKHPVKRMMSAIMVVLLCISLFSGLTFAAGVDYKTGNPEGFQNVILNWGTRGTTATFLSPNAKAFYEDNNVSYSQLAQQSGTSNVSAVPNSQLYKTLQNLMQANHEVITSYAATRPLYSYTDCQEGSRDKLTCFYSGIKIGPDWDSGATWNREHTWPNSKGMEGDDENDIMMLRPASSSVNSSRGNSAYGEGSGYFDPNSVSANTYKHNLHGDVARIFLYIYVRWGNTATAWGTDGVIESKDVLLKWMEEDPVDTWEMGRNDSVESITGTRNVFVDYPELAFVLFDAEVPTTMTTPSGEAINSGITYAITPVSNNPAWGTVSLTGKTINAVPAAGYRVAGYTVVSGDAQVTRNGNAFTVDADSDCTIRIIFEAREEVDVVFMENGTQADCYSVYADDVYTLPAHISEVPEGYTFQGWVTAQLGETTTKPATIYAPGKNLTAETDVTFYALYTRLDTTSSGNSTAYKLFTGELEEGNYLITYDNGAMNASVNSKNRLEIVSVTPDASNTIDEPAASIVWKLSFVDNDCVTLYNEATGTYAAGTGVKNVAKLLTYVNDYAKWKVTGTDVYMFVNLGNEIKGVNKTLRRNSDYGFACYAESTGGDLTLYKQVGGTVFYTTNAIVCDHLNTRQEAAVAPGCETVGYTAGVFCEDCQSYASGHVQLDALGHNYETKVTPPTVTNSGYTTYTCTVCGHSYNSDYIDPIGEQYTVSFKVPAGVPAIADQICGDAGITLPTAGVPAGETKYTFLGWTTDIVDNTTESPEILTGSYRAPKDITLYALYSYAVGGSAEVGWKLVEDAAALTAGDKVVLAARDKSKVAADIYSQYMTDTDAVFSEDLVTITELPETAMIFTLAQSGSDTWTLTNQLGKQLCATALKKVAWDRGTNTWTITVNELGNVILFSTEAAYGRFLYNVNSPRFTTYTSDPSNSMLMPQLYRLEGDLGVTHFTTEIGGNTNPGVSGTVTSFGEANGIVTVELYAGENLIASTTTTDGSYTLNNVPAGAYTLKISKANHVTRTYEVTVEDEAVKQDVKICLIGDVTGDGKINMGDVSKAFVHIRGKALITDEYALACADATGDTKLNLGDISKIFAHVRGKNPLF